jgi:ribosomal-protein-alanine N-acetyltransferase
MRRSEILVKMPRVFLAFFRSQRLSEASKWGKIKDNRMSTPFSIRLLRLADLDRILEIERASFGEDAYDRNLFADFYHKCGDLFLVAVRGRKVCGYMVTCRGGGAAQGRAELVSVAVDPRLRGKGIASALMDSTLRRLRRRRIPRLRLVVKVTNHPAIAFYERYGFTRLRIARRYYEDGADGWLMARVP